VLFSLVFVKEVLKPIKWSSSFWVEDGRKWQWLLAVGCWLLAKTNTKHLTLTTI